jgi:hypothetical protein
MADYSWWITVLLTPAALGIIGFFAYVEYQARQIKTRVERISGGLRFVARGWSVEMQRGPQRVVVRAQHGQHRRAALDSGVERQYEGAIQQALPAPGLRIRLEPDMRPGVGDAPAVPTGLLVPVFEASDATPLGPPKEGGEQHVVRLAPVPAVVAASFNQFAGQVRIWVDKLDRNVEMQVDQEAQRLEAEAAIAARAEAKAKKDAELAKAAPVDPETQIALWRKEAGFSGTSETGLSEDGRLEWFIDLDPRGRVILHSDKRTLYTTLLGARIETLGAELEVGVRDQFWTEAEADLQVFRLFKGAHSDVRRAWKERLEILTDKLRSGEITPR